jgi:hypothetical protein
MANPGTDGHSPRLWFYRLPPTDGRSFEWAEVVLGSNGFFSAVSDYGNYSFRWTHFGDRDFRAWLLGVDEHYVRSKIMACSNRKSDIYDDRSSLQAARRAICELRREGWLEKEDARAAWDEIDDDYGQLHTEFEWNDWANHSRGAHLIGGYRDLYEEMFREMPEPQSRQFVERILPRLKEAIRAELAAEQPAPAPPEAA